MEVTRRAVTTLDENRRALQQKHVVKEHNDKWNKLVIETMKCNVDAALFSESNCFVYEMCIRDTEGCFVHASSAHFEGSQLTGKGRSLWPAMHSSQAEG